MTKGELVRYGLALACSLPIRLVPSRFRFRVLSRLAHALVPLVGAMLLRRHGNVVGSRSDETARAVFRATARMRIPFDVTFLSDIDEDVLPTLREGGAIFVTAHFPLNPLFTRWLLDQGHVPITVRNAARGAPISWGTSTRLDLLHPGRNALVEMREALRRGRAVLAAVDRAQPGVRALNVSSRLGNHSIATPVFTLAAKMNVPVFFFGARATGDGHAVVTVRRIAPDPAPFITCFQGHIAEMLPSGS